MHGGKIGVISAGEGNGSTFFFELPLYEKIISIDISTDGPLFPSESTKDKNAPVTPSSISWVRNAITKTPKIQASDTHEDIRKVEERDLNQMYQSGALTSIPSQTIIERREVPGGDLEQGSDIRRSHTTLSSEITPYQSSLGGIEIRTNYDDDWQQTSHLSLRRKSLLYQPLGMLAETGDGMEKEAHADGLQSNDKRALRVLIVDDTTTTRKITAKLLVSLGYEVEEASDGLIFLRKIGVKPDGTKSSPTSRQLFDFVLMDDSMPNMCGPDATAAARAAGYKGVIFGVTGNTVQADLDNFISKGANFIFTKPLDLQQLQESIDQIFT